MLHEDVRGCDVLLRRSQASMTEKVLSVDDSELLRVGRAEGLAELVQSEGRVGLGYAA
jgi:hypothetical protein